MADKEIIDFIKKYEGLSLKAYKCPAGVWTIGYGHTEGVKEGDEISLDRAEELIVQDVEKVERALLSYHAYKQTNKIKPITKGEHNALLSFAYNAGIVSTYYILYSMRDISNYSKVVNSTDPDAIKYSQWRFEKKDSVPYFLFLFRMYIIAGGKPLLGLFRRRTDEYYNFFIK
mgnify:CR=1 FL=1